MESNRSIEMTQHIIAKAKAFGASLIGVTDLKALKGSPSHRKYGDMSGLQTGEAVIVLALVHEQSNPELDWWDNTPGGTPGNRRLHAIAKRLKEWLRFEYSLTSQIIPYSFDQGNVFFKDAAALAGLGIIGMNNLLVTPEYGPRVRLVVMILDIPLHTTGPIEFSPCDSCSKVCRFACPQRALDTSHYNKARCMRQMHVDEMNKTTVKTPSGLLKHHTKYCRACELACPVGR